MKVGHPGFQCSHGIIPSSDCIECRRAYRRDQYNKHKTKRLKYFQDRWKVLRLEVLTRYGVNGIPQCHCCGEQHIEFLAVDHVEGGGNAHRKEVGSGWRFFYWLKRMGFPEGFRDLCHNCNMARGFLGYCPHEKERDTANQRTGAAAT